MANPNQLTTMDEAKTIASELWFAGGGVKDIYIPEYLGPYSSPENGLAKFYHFRFHNGAEGFNAGLIREFRKMFKFTWPQIIMDEVNREGKTE